MIVFTIFESIKSAGVEFLMWQFFFNLHEFIQCCSCDSFYCGFSHQKLSNFRLYFQLLFSMLWKLQYVVININFFIISFVYINSCTLVWLDHLKIVLKISSRCLGIFFLTSEWPSSVVQGIYHALVKGHFVLFLALFLIMLLSSFHYGYFIGRFWFKNVLFCTLCFINQSLSIFSSSKIKFSHYIHYWVPILYGCNFTRKLQVSKTFWQVQG